MNQKDILLYVELKKLKPNEVQAGLQLFRQIKIEHMKLEIQQLPANRSKNPNEAFHDTVARMVASHKNNFLVKIKSV